MTEIDRDEFEQWKVNPVTKWVLAGIAQATDDAREQFLQLCFYGNGADPKEMGMLRGAFFALMGLSANELTYERVMELHESSDTVLDLTGAWVAKSEKTQ